MIQNNDNTKENKNDIKVLRLRKFIQLPIRFGYQEKLYLIPLKGDIRCTKTLLLTVMLLPRGKKAFPQGKHWKQTQRKVNNTDKGCNKD